MNPEVPQKWIQLFNAWLAFLPNLLREHYDEDMRPPLFISEQVLKESKYLEHFPQHIFALKKTVKNAKQYLTPASCLHVYPQLKQKKIRRFSTLITAHCARFEGGKWKPPYRLPDFHMVELVVIGEEKYVNSAQQKIRELLTSTFTELGLQGEFQNATDAFFLGQSRGAKIIQKLKGLKQEYVVRDGRQSVAIASINSHEDFFGRCFQIRSGNSLAHSFCAAFGVERLTTYSLKAWGGDQNNWPKIFRDYVAIPQ